MARPLRCECPGGWYHVTARGNERKDIFRRDRDPAHFLQVLAELEDRFGLEVRAHVLMGNHHHLLLRSRAASTLFSTEPIPFHAQARKRRLSLTDFASFEAMTARGCWGAWADDEHFRKLGYLLPA